MYVIISTSEKESIHNAFSLKAQITICLILHPNAYDLLTVFKEREECKN